MRTKGSYFTNRHLTALTCILALAGCMSGPFDGGEIESRLEPMLIGGYIQAPDTQVVVQLKREPAVGSSIGRPAPSDAWVDIATTRSDPQGMVDSEGERWYHWSVTVVPPRDGIFWPSDGQGASTGQFRALIDNRVPAYVFTAAEFECTLRAITRAGQGYRQAAQGCGVAGHIAHVKAPCDARFDGGCYDRPTLTQLIDYPKARAYDFANGIQGVTHDETHWFFTSAHRANAPDPVGFFTDYLFGDESLTDSQTVQVSRIARAPVTQDLQNPPQVRGNPYAPHYRHFGDLDHHDGYLYVALEADSGSANHNAVGVFRARDLVALPALPLPTDNGQGISNPQRSGGRFPWIARNPKDGYFYSSTFSDARALHRYDITPRGIRYLGSIPLVVEANAWSRLQGSTTATLQRVQGGAFSPDGRLYLSSDDPNTRAITMIDIVGTDGTAGPQQGVVLGAGDLTWDPSKVTREEIEGLTIWDLDDGRAPNIEGQIHVILLDNDLVNNDDFYFKHMRATPLSKL